MSEEYKGQLAEAPAAEAWKRWLGKTVNGEFPLREYLEGSAHRAVFLTEYDHRPAAIHLVSENFPDRTRQLESWQLAAETSHANLTRVFQVGLCQIESEELFYAVMEFAEENLGQILTHRPLSAEETSEMLKPALDALAYLHKRGLAHGALSPANIWAMGDQLKLSCGDLCRADEAIRVAGKYDPPEPVHSPAADMWSLGMTIVEVLTQRLPRWDRNGAADPEVSPGLPTPLLDAARNCLHRDIKRRWTAEEVSDHLSGKVRTRPERVQAVVPAASSSEPKPKNPAAREASVARVPKPPGPKPHLQEQRVARVAPAAAVRNTAPKKPRTVAYAVVFVIVASLIAIKLITRAPQPLAPPPVETAQPAAASHSAGAGGTNSCTSARGSGSKCQRNRSARSSEKPGKYRSVYRATAGRNRQTHRHGFAVCRRQRGRSCGATVARARSRTSRYGSHSPGDARCAAERAADHTRNGAGGNQSARGRVR